MTKPKDTTREEGLREPELRKNIGWPEWVSRWVSIWFGQDLSVEEIEAFNRLADLIRQERERWEEEND